MGGGALRFVSADSLGWAVSGDIGGLGQLERLQSVLSQIKPCSGVGALCEAITRTKIPTPKGSVVSSAMRCVASRWRVR